MAELTIAVDDALARELQQDEKTPGGDEFRQLLTNLGLRLRPLHAGTTDRELARWFTATPPGDEDIERVLDRVRRHPGVLAAYSKPRDELP